MPTQKMSKAGLRTFDALGTPRLEFHGRAILERPNIALKISSVVSSWSTLEAFNGYLLGLLMDANPTATMALLTRFSTSSQTSQALKAVGKATLEPQKLQELDKLIKKVEKLASARNDIMHGLWGVDHTRNNELAWLHPSSLSTLGISLPTKAFTGADEIQFSAEILSKVTYYDEKKLDNLINEINNLSCDIQKFISPIAID